MTQTYKLVDLEEGTPVQFLGVYALKWRPEMGEPTVGFVEDDEVETLHARVAELEAAILQTGGTYYHEIYKETCIFCGKDGGDHSDDCIYQELWKKTQQTEVEK